MNKIREVLANLKLLDDPQVELCLLRGCMGIPKMAFALRSAPPDHILSAAREFDSLIAFTCAERFGLSLEPA